MRRRTFVSTVAAAAVGPALSFRRTTAPSSDRHAGLWFDAYQAGATAGDFARLRALGATHVALAAYARMERLDSTEVVRWAGPDDDRSLTDDGLAAQAKLARAAGLAVFLSPIISDPVDGAWRGEIRMRDEHAWSDWFDGYGRFVLAVADLAAAAGAAGMSVGTELRGTARRERQWRSLIAEVRQRFDGWTTYAANWNDYAAVPWWDAVDYAGLQAYFPLGDPGQGDRAERAARLAAAWEPVAADLAAFSGRVQRPVLLTEIGYKSAAGSTAEPWLWRPAADPDPDLQAAAYEAAFRTFWHAPWCAGIYWWKWHPADPAVADRWRDFTPQGKPAEEVLRRWFGATG